jgi:hypothetical protein
MRALTRPTNRTASCLLPAADRVFFYACRADGLAGKKVVALLVAAGAACHRSEMTVDGRRLTELATVLLVLVQY